ncbi:RF-1 domain-containing protein [Bisporella sp. PMI_857]|nr:RF-1 domain-containing protein [Bisporella sp. PMI_857]
MLRGIISSPRWISILDSVSRCAISRRTFNASSSACKKKMPDRPALIPEEEFTETFLKGSGPGGQKINKTASAVQLKHIPTGMVLKVQHTRSRSQNRKIAREMLAERVEMLEKGEASRAAVVGETKKKKKSSAVKKSRRKYRLLEESKARGHQDPAQKSRDPHKKE